MRSSEGRYPAKETDMPTHLRCRELAPGDVLLRVHDGSVLSRVDLAQEDVRAIHATVVHAGILCDRTFVIEAHGEGIFAHDLRVRNLRYGYLVYRCIDPKMAAGAAKCARVLADMDRAGGGPGSPAVAAGSFLGDPLRAAARPDLGVLRDRILEARNQRFFSSQFVVYVYQFVARQRDIPAPSFFTGGDAKASPSFLAAAFVRHPLFREAGRLMPGLR